MIGRKLNWVSSIHRSGGQELAVLEKKIASFYAGNPDYYTDIEFTADNWIDKKEEGYQQIISFARESKMMCEFGCGSANILKHFPELSERYRGCDFSQKLIVKNREKYPAAFFEVINAPNELPFPDNMFDLVFSVFVLEHSTNPSKLLDECARILQKGGRLVILCPDFLGKGRMSSQRAGWSEGNTRDKLKKGNYLDALLTFYDNRIKIPFYCWMLRLKAKKTAQFFINTTPTVFEDKFYPDADALYVTYKEEIIEYMLSRSFLAEKNSHNVEMYAHDKKIIFLSFTKK